MSEKLALTINEAVRATGLSRSSLYVLIAEGKLTSRKAGKRTLLLVSDLEAYLSSLPAGGRTRHAD